jgi:DNA-binding NarL/FixJ family response regulator
MERASMQEILKREQEQTRLEKEQHRLENEKHAKQRQSSAIAMYQDGLSIEKIAAYLNTDKNEILIMIEDHNQ